MLLMKCAVLIAAAWTVGCFVADPQDSPPLGTLSICEVLRNPLKYNDKTIAVRGIYSTGEGHGGYIKAEDCAGILENDFYRWTPIIHTSLTQQQMENRGHDVRFMRPLKNADSAATGASIPRQFAPEQLDSA